MIQMMFLSGVAPDVTKFVSYHTYNNTNEVREYLKWAISEN